MKRLYNGTLVPQNKEVTGERNLLPQSSKKYKKGKKGKKWRVFMKKNRIITVQNIPVTIAQSK